MAAFRGWVWDEQYTYETVGGDVWDDLARQAYDDEHLAPLLIFANPRYADVLIFEGGEEITIPVISEAVSALAPPWKGGAP